MVAMGTSQLSSKGQIVIPEEIRDRLGLIKGSKFVVVAEGDVVMLKLIRVPGLDAYKPMLAKVRKVAKQSGLTKSDIKPAIKKARAKRRAKA
jgi:AbrB family looped-hinge helix DNA binding protein